MKASQFTYTRADSVERAVSLLATEGDGAKLIAGGGSLISLLRYRLANVERLIDIGRLDEIAGIQVSGGCSTIGGVMRQAAIEDSGSARDTSPSWLRRSRSSHIGRSATGAQSERASPRQPGGRAARGHARASCDGRGRPVSGPRAASRPKSCSSPIT